MFRSRDIQVFVFLTIPWFTKSVTSWWVLVHETVHFWIYILNHNSLTHQTWSIDRCKQGQYFSKIFWATQRTGAKFQALFNLATCSNYSRTNYVKFSVLHFLKGWIMENWKRWISAPKNWQVLLHCHFIKIVKGPGTSFQSPTLSQKHVRNVCYKIH